MDDLIGTLACRPLVFGIPALFKWAHIADQDDVRISQRLQSTSTIEPDGQALK